MAWSLGAFLLYKFSRNSPVRAAFIIGLAVFSHWVLDLIVHIPDLALYDNTYKMGLGLWNYPAVAFALEAILLFGGMAFYFLKTKPVSILGKIGMPVLGVLLLVLQTVVFFAAPPDSPASAAVTALVLYIVIAAGAFWLERYRV